MKSKFTLVAILLILAMLPLSLFGCNGAQETSGTSESTSATTTKKQEDATPQLEGTEYVLKDNIDKIKINGRYTVSNSGIACDNVGSGIEFQGTMKGKVYLTFNAARIVWGETKNVYYTVYVDGVRQEERYEVPCGKNGIVLTLADFGETEGEHRIRVVKQTEAHYALAYFAKITMDGTFGERPADKDYLVEFVGSDLICGMGNYNGTPEQQPSAAQVAEYEDGTKSMSFIAAESLHADCSILGVSGMGVAGSWFGVTAPEYYKANSYFRNKKTEYDFSKGRTPDLIVLNIGKNDNNIPVADRPTDEVFKQTAKEYLELLKETHGEDVKIIWTYDITEANPDRKPEPLEANDCRYKIAQEVIEELGGEEAGLYIYQVYTNRLGGQEHTDAEGHVTAATGLLNFIREKGILPVAE